jgi:membrane-associated phospholipid phosphatase
LPSDPPPNSGQAEITRAAVRRSRLDQPHRIVAVVTIIAVAVFLLTWTLVRLDMTTGFDRQLVYLFRNPANPADPLGPGWFEEAAAQFSALGGYTILLLLLTLACTTLVIIRQQAMAWFLVVSFAGGSTVSTLLKLIKERARPDIVDQFDRVFTSGFPSAHAMVSMLTYMLLASRHRAAVHHARLAPVRAHHRCMLIGDDRHQPDLPWRSLADRRDRRLERRPCLGRCELAYRLLHRKAQGPAPAPAWPIRSLDLGTRLADRGKNVRRDIHMARVFSHGAGLITAHARQTHAVLLDHFGK